jgi:hypothetical protein
MQVILASLFIGLFISLLFTNFYFKSKLVKKFKILTQHKVGFNFSHLISERKMREEILPHYPQIKEDIIDFQKIIKRAFITMIGILAVISFAGYLVIRSKF